MTEFYIVGLAAIAGFAIQSKNYCIMIIAPAYAVFIYAMILGTYFYTDSLGNYIREEIELKKIPDLLGDVSGMVLHGEKVSPECKTDIKWETGWLAWETNFCDRLSKGRPPGRKKMLCVFSWGIILVSTISLIFGLVELEVHAVMVMFLALIVFGGFGFLAEWVRRHEYPGKR